ncbi:hypothetical protein PFICI_03304 [Pestalotiopsis fici W106-1]|uniref:Gfo/Idh/MocA-like oxidoreductase C-terminal domain-containing protein n=1 Tax=Pestalotiopsis fici (strain W106-1 / CGMCC3.15140) TaxID=1229662 RepID=W3XH13_PESFW|nr:uncharacterized protein PFICI_03304 [Pestalotiopsis fici W106-1]ETS85279.1 hypothetical protein PFICI_03304 [Pestalotiopsis fici W106-1]
MGVVALVLGLLPTVFMLIGPEPEDISLLAFRRPILAAFLAISLPSFPISIVSTSSTALLRQPIGLPFQPWFPANTPTWGKALLSACEYALAGAAVANMVFTVYQLAFWAISVSTIAIQSGVLPSTYGPFMWLGINLVVQAIGFWVFYLRYERGPDLSGNGSTGCWLSRELTPCIYGQPMRLRFAEDTYLCMILSSFLTIGAVVLLVFTTMVLAGQIFISLGDAVAIVGRNHEQGGSALKFRRAEYKRSFLLMEGMWTRYFPLSTYVRDITSSGRLGTLQRIMSEHSLAYVDLAPDHIMVNPDLAGGILLDGGVYSLFWVFQAVYHAKDFQSRPRPVTHSFCSKYASTGVDAMTTILMEFPRAEKYGGPVHAVASTSLSLSIDAVAMNAGCEMPNIRIQGTMGEVQIFPPAYRPTKTRLILKDGTVKEKSWPQPGPGVGSGWYNGYGSTIHPEGEGHGLFWEADEAGRAICGGQKDRLSRDLEESILVLEIMDQVRAKAGLAYPKAVESTEY